MSRTYTKFLGDSIQTLISVKRFQDRGGRFFRCSFQEFGDTVQIAYGLEYHFYERLPASDRSNDRNTEALTQKIVFTTSFGSAHREVYLWNLRFDQ